MKESWVEKWEKKSNIQVRENESMNKSKSNGIGDQEVDKCDAGKSGFLLELDCQTIS